MIPLTSLGKLQKCQFVKTVTTCACILHVQSLDMWASSVSLQIDIANYWPGMHITAFLLIFTDLCERGSFWQHLYVKLFKYTKENFSVFSTSFKHTIVLLKVKSKHHKLLVFSKRSPSTLSLLSFFQKLLVHIDKSKNTQKCDLDAPVSAGIFY